MTFLHRIAVSRRSVAWLLLSVAALSGCAAQKVAHVPHSVVVDARANGIVVRAEDAATFITDDTSNSVLVSKDGERFTRYASIDAVAGQANSLSQLSLGEGHTLFVARFGFGTAGGVFEIGEGGAVTALSGLDPTRRRLGLVSIGAGRLLSSWFVKGDNPSQAGGVSLIVYDEQTHIATERDLLLRLGKPVGIGVFRGRVFIADQQGNRIVDADLAALLAADHPLQTDAVLASVGSPDLLAVGRDGTLFTKCGPTGVCSIAQNGSVTALPGDFDDVRGVAVDETGGWLYVVDRAKSAQTPSYVRVLPVH